LPRPPTPTLFPYTTLFRSLPGCGAVLPRFSEAAGNPCHAGLGAQRVCVRSASTCERRNPREAPGGGVSTSFRIESQEVVAALLRSEEHTSELQSRFDLVCR